MLQLLFSTGFGALLGVALCEVLFGPSTWGQCFTTFVIGWGLAFAICSFALL